MKTKTSDHLKDWYFRSAFLLLVATIVILLFTGCAGVQTPFTKPTGVITIPRQDFINTYASLKVLTESLVADAERGCSTKVLDAQFCTALPGMIGELKQIDNTIQAKIAVPESEINWDTIAKLIGVLVSLKP
jgi:hypothetical protein